jgi:hypothetical protein
MEMKPERPKFPGIIELSEAALRPDLPPESKSEKLGDWTDKINLNIQQDEPPKPPDLTGLFESEATPKDES